MSYLLGIHVNIILHSTPNIISPSRIISEDFLLELRSHFFLSHVSYTFPHLIPRDQITINVLDEEYKL